MTMRRLFIGLMASPTTQAAISAYQLNWEWPASARLIAPEKMHLTLLFLGDVDEADEARLRAELRGVPIRPIYLRLSKAGTFRGGIAIVRPEESRELEMLQGDIAAVAHHVGLNPDTMPWQPHVTLARDAQGCVLPSEPPSIEMDVLQFSLVCSRPERGYSYEIVESWPAA